MRAPSQHPQRPRRGDAGTALLLVPAALSVVLVLAAVAVDLSAVHLGQRQLLVAAAGAANDAATYALDEHLLRAGQGHHLSPQRAAAVVTAGLAATGVLARLAGPPRTTIAGATVTVQLAMEVQGPFSRALPGSPGRTTVTARASATAERR